MWKKVQDFMQQHHMLMPGDRVIAAISGGADSVCLLSVLKYVITENPDDHLICQVVHVHHGLRGAEADRDAAFVEALCRQFNFPCRIIYKDVPEYARAHSCSGEEAARILRYQALDEAAAEAGGTKIALAHHRDDNAETILHHLVRGSGLRGLAGMRPVQNQRIRPLLCLDRSDVICYLKEQQLTWVEDSTNASGDYTRNRIRHEVMPLLTDMVNDRAVDHILQAGSLFAQADDYFSELSGQIWAGQGREVRNQDGELIAAELNITALSGHHPLVRSYLYGRMIAALVPGRKNITARHYTAIEQLITAAVGSRCSLPGNIVVIRDYEMLRVYVPEIYDRNHPDVVSDLRMEHFPYKKDAEIPTNRYTKWFDYDKIKGTLSVRTRQSGDYFTLKDGSKKSIRRFMIDHKIPQHQRDQILLVAEGEHILWIVGYRISEHYKITEHTKMILQVTYDGGELNGR